MVRQARIGTKGVHQCLHRGCNIRIKDSGVEEEFFVVYNHMCVSNRKSRIKTSYGRVTFIENCMDGKQAWKIEPENDSQRSASKEIRTRIKRIKYSPRAQW